MALDDRFNRGADHWLIRFDGNLTAHAERCGALWLRWTPWGRHTLAQGLLALGGFAALERVIVLHDILYLAVAFLAIQAFMRTGFSWTGGLVEQIQYEAAGLPRWMASAVNILCLFTGLFALSNALGYALASLVNGTLAPPALVDSLLSGLAFGCWKAGEYVARTVPGGPSGTPRRMTI